MSLMLSAAAFFFAAASAGRFLLRLLHLRLRRLLEAPALHLAPLPLLVELVADLLHETVHVEEWLRAAVEARQVVQERRQVV